MNKIIIIIFDKLKEVYHVNPLMILMVLAFTGYVTIPLYFYYLFIINKSYSNNSYEKFKSSYEYEETKMQEYYKILGCSVDDDFDLIKERYRNLSKKFHPDFINGKNVDKEFIEFATEKMKIINNAYMKIKSVQN